MKRSLIGVAAAAAVATGLVACGSDDQSSSAGTAAKGSGEIKFMAIGQIQASSFSLPGLPVGAEAAVNRINAAGGIDGRKIKLLTCNDKGNPNGAAACAAQAVKEKVAAVTTFSQYGTNIMPLLEKAGIPDVLDNALAPTDYTSPNAFPILAVPTSFPGVSMTLAQEGCKKIGVISLDVANSRAGVKTMEAGAKAMGADFVAVFVSPTAQEFAAPVATLISKGVDCITFSMPPQQAAPAIVAIRQTGKPIRIGALTTVVPEAVLAQLKQAGDGIIGVNVFYPSTSTDKPKVAEMVADVQKTDPKVTPAEAQNSYAAVMVFAQAAKGLKEVDGKSVLAKLKTMNHVDVGLFEPVDFTALPIIKAVPRAAATKIIGRVAESGKYEPLNKPPIDITKAFAQ